MIAVSEMPVTQATPVTRFPPVFYAVFGLTVVSLGICVYLANGSTSTDEAKRLFETCSTTWKLGFGALVGLLGARAL